MAFAFCFDQLLMDFHLKIKIFRKMPLHITVNFYQKRSEFFATKAMTIRQFRI